MSTENRGRREQHRERRSLGEKFQQWRQQRREWIAGMTRGQRIRHRLLQAAVVLAIAIIAVWAVMSAWIRVPKVPDPPTAGPDTTQQPGEGEDIQFTGAELPNVAKSGRKEGYYTFLVVGRDVASGLTDTILLFTFDTNNKSLNAISLPRDTMINTSAKGGSLKRINVVYNRNRGSSDLPEAQRVENGMTALKQEVSRLTGIYPDFYVMVEWEAIGELVDALGGVHFDVPFDMNYDDPYQDLHIHQEAGYRKLSGEDAMEVIRWRKNNGEPSPGDVGRIQNQRRFMAAAMRKLINIAGGEDGHNQLYKYLSTIYKNKWIATDMTVNDLTKLADFAGKLKMENVRVNMVPGEENDPAHRYNGNDVYSVHKQATIDMLNKYFRPYQRPMTEADTAIVEYITDYKHTLFDDTSSNFEELENSTEPVRDPAAAPEWDG